MIPGGTVEVGNARIYASAGAILRVGDGLAADWGPQRLRPSPTGSTLGRFGSELGWYAFAGFEGRVVGRDVTLDGNTFRDSRSVDREVLVGDLQAGAAVLWRGMRLSYTHTIRTKQFDNQKGTQGFGSVNPSVPF